MVLVTSYLGIGDNKTFGYFKLISNGFLTLKLIVFKNISEFINFAVFCLFVTEPYYGLFYNPHIFSSKVQVVLLSFYFI